MKRKIYSKLVEWRRFGGHKPLLLLGARQVGKTWIMKEFGKREYKNLAYINCDNDTRFAEIIQDDYDIPRILLGIQAITGVKVEPHDTLVVIDEIQEAPRGLHCLKYFCEEAPQYDVIASGSMLGVAIGQKQSFPVGKVDILQMYPMTFEEFLIAKGYETWVETLNSGDWKLIDLLNTRLTDALRQYYYVGGMPEVVKSYIDNCDLKQVRDLQKDILDAYRRSASKYSDPRTAVRIGQVLDSLPSQLSKENKKFIYGAIQKGARAKDFELAIQWLVDAGIIYKEDRVSAARMPLKFYQDISCFKLYMVDCGLLACLTDAPASQMLISNNAFVEFKGAFTEQYVLQELKAAGFTPYYWSKDNSTSEVDFIIQYDSDIVPIEVKAEDNVRSKSLAQFSKDNDLKSLRVSLKGFVDQGWMINIPLYAIATYLLRVKGKGTDDRRSPRTAEV